MSERLIDQEPRGKGGGDSEVVPPFVSVIVPVYNDAEGLVKCLRALVAQTYRADRYEIVVVDNGSEIDISSVTSEYSIVRLAREELPGSYVARNKGISLSKGEVLAFIDSDCVAIPEWLQTGVDVLLATQNAGLVGGKVDFSFKNPSEPNIWEAYDTVVHFNQQAYIEKEGFSGAGNLFTTRAVFGRVGVFDAEIRSGGDREWSKRVGQAGLSLIYSDDAKVNHPARSTYAELSEKTRRLAGGMHYLNTSGQVSVEKVGFVHHLVPPLAVMKRALDDERWKPARRVHLMFLALMFKTIRTAEIIRIMIGGSARR